MPFAERRVIKMKIVNSKYSSKELRRIQDDAENKVKKKIMGLAIITVLLYMIVIAASLWLWSDSVRQECNTGSLLKNIVFALLITAKAAVFLWGMTRLFDGYVSLVYSFYEKKRKSREE